jgi:hypothetical protein
VRLLVLSFVLVLWVALEPPPARADAVLSSSATCSGSSIVVSWGYFESPPLDFPAWVGYDVYRQGIDPCTAPVRLNPEMLPRPAGDHSGQWVDSSPSSATAYLYLVVPVDLNRQPVSPPGCDCAPQAAVTCPNNSAAVARGRLEDDGVSMFILPCPGTCTPANFIYDHLDTLRAYAQAGIPLRLYGSVSCAGFEGCTLVLDHFEVADCNGPVPTLPTSWGGLKARYR